MSDTTVSDIYFFSIFVIIYHKSSLRKFPRVQNQFCSIPLNNTDGDVIIQNH